MKNYFYILAFIYCLINNTTYSQSLDWAISLGSAGSDIGRSIAFDSSGNSYTTGQFNNTIDFDPGSNLYNLTSSGGQDIFVQKLDSSGNFVWAKQMGGNGPGDNGYTIDIDGYGNVYVSGIFSGTSDFDPGQGTYNLTSAENYDIFVVKLDSNGNFIWAKRMGGGTIGLNHDDRSYSMKVDSLGNVYTTGFFQSTPGDFDPNSGVFNLSCNGGLDIFISKLDSGGNFIWAKQIGGSGYDVGNNVNIDNNGDIIITGYFEGTVDFDPGNNINNITSNGGVFILKLNSFGDFIWVKSLSSTTSSSINSLSGECSVVNNSNDIYVLGHYSNTVDFDTNVGVNYCTSNGETDIFLLKLDNNGDYQWVKSFGGAQSDYGYGGLSLDNSENVYVSGVFSNTMDSDPSALVSNLSSKGQLDIFISKFKPNGDFLGSLSFGSSSTDYVEDIKVLNNGIYTTGIHYGTTDFDPGSSEYNLTPGGVGAIFISKIETCFFSPNPLIILSPLTQTICSGDLIAPIELLSSVTSTTFNWTRNNIVNVTGIAAGGNGNIIGSLTNIINVPVIVTFIIIPITNECIGNQIIATVLVTPKVMPTFTQVAAVCSGATISALPTTSNNAVTGTWTPAINNLATTLYTFIPTAGLCANTATQTIGVSSIPVPTAMAQTFCTATTVANLVITGSNIQWYSEATGGTALASATALVTGTYYASQTINGCESPRVPAAVTVNQTPAMSGIVVANSLVNIGTQTWTTKNLDVATYSDGTVIPQVTDPTEWSNLTTGAWCYYDNNPANGVVYGKLYNFYAVAGIWNEASKMDATQRKKLAPTGYHVPSDAEWTTLTDYLGGANVAGGKMKATGTSLWQSPNQDATNSSGFTGLPGGYRDYDYATSNNIGSYGLWWSSSVDDAAFAWVCFLDFSYGFADGDYTLKTIGFSVRCLKD